MHYIIDGYNLLFRFIQAGNNLKEQRQELLDEISKKIDTLQIDATIVFDAQFQEGGLTRSYISHLEVLFTAEGETADEYIIDSLKTEQKPRQETVVTSDKKLAWQARRHLAKTESVEEFLAWLNKRYKNKRRQKKNKPAEVKPSASSSKQSTGAAEPPVKAPGKTLPQLLATPEECFTYYLDEFVIRYEKLEMETESPKKKAKKEEKKYQKAAKKTDSSAKKEEWFVSDMDRWLCAFETDQQNP